MDKDDHDLLIQVSDRQIGLDRRIKTLERENEELKEKMAKAEGAGWAMVKIGFVLISLVGLAAAIWKAFTGH